MIRAMLLLAGFPSRVRERLEDAADAWRNFWLTWPEELCEPFDISLPEDEEGTS